MDLCRILPKSLLIIIQVCFFYFFSSYPINAVTRYVNSDSNGSAGNPTRAFNDPNYSPNDSYQTLSAAYTAASVGDIIEFSGGTDGKTYQTRNGSIAKANLTLRGSTITNHNGTVTIDYNTGGGDYTIAANAVGITVQKLTIVRTGGVGPTVSLYSSGALFKDVTISNNNGNSPIFGVGGANNNTFENCVINNIGLSGIQNNLATNSGTITFNNCLITGMIYQAFDIYGGVTLNLNNSFIVASGQNAGCNFRFFNSGGVVNTNNSLIHGGAAYPNTFTCGSGTGTWNTTNDIVDSYPYFNSTKAGLGKFFFTVDDQNNIGYGVTVADFLRNNYNLPVSYYIDATYSISSANKAKLQYLYKQGHEVGTHTRHHSDLSQTNALRVTYSGASADITLQVGNSGTVLNIIGTGDTHGPIDLTNTSYDTVGELCTLIGTWSNFTCAKYSTNINSLVSSKGLKDTSTNLAIGISAAIPFDDDVGPDNRYYKDEITNSITDIETAIREDSECAAYTVKSLAYPYNFANTQVISWIRNNTSLTASRSVSTTGSLREKSYLGGINLYNLSTLIAAKGVGYSGLSDADKEIRIRRAAQAIATSVSQGYIFGFLSHTVSEFTTTEYGWFLDEFSKFTTISNITIDTLANHVNDIRTSGLWTDGGVGIWSRTFSGSDDFRLSYQSPAINVGITISGIITDFLGNPIVGLPDIGPYEFQNPQAPSSLNQKESDGTTSLQIGNYAQTTSVILKLGMSSPNARDIFTPEIEIRELGTSFSNMATNVGNTVVFSGVAVTGSVIVSELNSGNYHWQARVVNSVGQGTWVSFGNNDEDDIDFKIGSEPTPTPDVFSVVDTNLTSNGIDTNLGEVSDPTNAINVYFEKVGLGKIQFNSSLDLTDPVVTSWLQDLGNKLDMSIQNQIGLDADTVKDLINTQAVLTMYNITLNNPKILVNNSDDNSGVVSGLVYDRIAHTLTFTAAHFTTFTAVENSSSSSTPNNNNSSDSNSASTCSDFKPTIAPDLFQINTSQNSAKLFFTPLPDTSIFYVTFSEKPNAEQHGEQVTLIREGVQSHMVYYLKPNTTYYVKVRGQNGCMPGEWSNIIKFKTDSKKYYKYSSTKTFSKKTAIKNTMAKSSPVDVKPSPIITPQPLPTSTPAKPVVIPTKSCFLWWCR